MSRENKGDPLDVGTTKADTTRVSNPNQTSNMTNQATQTLPPVDSAKILVKRLKAAFPGVKFSRRMSRGTAYGSLTISWTDGPTSDEVQEITQPFVGTSFDGMTDSTNHLMTAIKVGDDVFQSGLGYIFRDWNHSDAEIERASEMLRAEGYSADDSWSMHHAARSVLRGVEIWHAANVHHLNRN